MKITWQLRTVDFQPCLVYILHNLGHNTQTPDIHIIWVDCTPTKIYSHPDIMEKRVKGKLSNDVHYVYDKTQMNRFCYQTQRLRTFLYAPFDNMTSSNTVYLLWNISPSIQKFITICPKCNNKVASIVWWMLRFCSFETITFLFSGVILDEHATASSA